MSNDQHITSHLLFVLELSSSLFWASINTPFVAFQHYTELSNCTIFRLIEIFCRHHGSHKSLCMVGCRLKLRMMKSVLYSWFWSRLCISKEGKSRGETVCALLLRLMKVKTESRQEHGIRNGTIYIYYLASRVLLYLLLILNSSPSMFHTRPAARVVQMPCSFRRLWPVEFNKEWIRRPAMSKTPIFIPQFESPTIYELTGLNFSVDSQRTTSDEAKIGVTNFLNTSSCVNPFS